MKLFHRKFWHNNFNSVIKLLYLLFHPFVRPCKCMCAWGEKLGFTRVCPLVSSAGFLSVRPLLYIKWTNVWTNEIVSSQVMTQQFQFCHKTIQYLPFHSFIRSYKNVYVTVIETWLVLTSSRMHEWMDERTKTVNNVKLASPRLKAGSISVLLTFF